MKYKRRRNYFWWIFLAPFVIFAILNIIWFSFMQVVYKPLMAEVPEEHGFHLMPGEDGTQYYVSPPDYLSFSGNIGVFDENQNNITIWPKGYNWPHMFGKATYAIELNLSSEKGLVKAIEFLVDENGDLLKESETKENIKLWEENQEVIQALFEHAHNKWEIN